MHIPEGPLSVSAVGLGILATEFVWARFLLKRVQDRLGRFLNSNEKK